MVDSSSSTSIKRATTSRDAKVDTVRIDIAEQTLQRRLPPPLQSDNDRATPPQRSDPSDGRVPQRRVRDGATVG